MSIHEIIKINVLVVGNYQVGKTSLIRRFVDQSFIKEYHATVGSDMSIRECTVRIGAQPINVRLIIYDIGGQDHFHDRVLRYTNMCQVFLVCYDITDGDHFSEVLQKWLDLLRQAAGLAWNIHGRNVIFVGTKNDLADPYPIANDADANAISSIDYARENHHAVSLNYVNQACAYFGCPNAIQTSAKDGDNVDRLFQIAAERGLAARLRNNYQSLLQTGVTRDEMERFLAIHI